MKIRPSEKEKEETSGPNKQRRYNRRTGKTENFNQRNKRIEANLPKKADTETDEDLTPEMARQEERKRTRPEGFIPETSGPANVPLLSTCQGTPLALKNAAIVGGIEEPRGLMKSPV